MEREVTDLSQQKKQEIIHQIFFNFVKSLEVLLSGLRAWGCTISVLEYNERRKAITLSYLYQVRSLANRAIEKIEKIELEEIE